MKDWVTNIIEVKQQYHSAMETSGVLIGTNVIMVKAAVLSAMETISAVLAAREGQNLFAIR